MNPKVRNIKILVCIAAIVSAAACSPSRGSAVIEGFSLGTVYRITVKGDVPDGLGSSLDSLFTAADNSMSVFNANSLLSRLNRNETDSLDPHISYCIELARTVSVLSGGKYDITIRPLVEAYGFSGEASTGEVDLDSLLQLVGYDKISVAGGRLVKENPGTRIDLNSIAKGYTVDMAASLLEGMGVTEYLVDIGGEIFCRGTNPHGKPWVVGIETPADGSYIQGASIERRLSVSGCGVATSGNYRNFRTDVSGRRLTHIIDPQTGMSTQSNLLSATVVAENCALADAMATMFIVLGLEWAIELLYDNPEIAALFIYTNPEGQMHTYHSAAMKPYLTD